MQEKKSEIKYTTKLWKKLLINICLENYCAFLEYTGYINGIYIMDMEWVLRSQMFFAKYVINLKSEI